MAKKGRRGGWYIPTGTSVAHFAEKGHFHCSGKKSSGVPIESTKFAVTRCEGCGEYVRGLILR